MMSDDLDVGAVMMMLCWVWICETGPVTYQAPEMKSQVAAKTQQKTAKKDWHLVAADCLRTTAEHFLYDG
jgi:hypothetical protein